MSSNTEYGDTEYGEYGDFKAHAALHAFNATTLARLYDSRGLLKTGNVTSFSTPTIFSGHVYMGTRGEVDVFGLCNSQPGGCVQ